MAVGRSGGALAALALAGVAYFFRNRKQVSNKVQELTQRAQHQLGSSHSDNATTTSSNEPSAYTGDTVRM
jgi:hypothetical protein